MEDTHRESAPSRLRAVLFDAGGTLIYMPRNPEETLQEVCRQWGLSVSTEEARQACRRSERYYSQHYLSYRGDQGEFWRRFHGEALRVLGIEDPTGEKADYLSHVFGRAGVWLAFPEAAPVCERLRSMGLRLGVVSNGPTTTCDLLSQNGLLAHFDVVVASQALGIQKPNPRIFVAALEKLRVSPREALFVGDLYEVDVVGARAAGIPGVLIDRRHSAIEVDCPVIRSLEELVPLVMSCQPSAWRGWPAWR